MRILFVSLVTAVALFLFGFVWWGLLMPVVRPASVIAAPELIDQISSSLVETDIYFHPDYAEEPGESTGPTAILYFNREMPSMGKMMGMGFGHMFLTSLMVCVFVSFLKLPSFAGRLTFVFALGLFAALWADVGNMIWWRHPTLWTIFHFGYDTCSWLLAGVIISAMVKPCSVDGGPESGTKTNVGTPN